MLETYLGHHHRRISLSARAVQQRRLLAGVQEDLLAIGEVVRKGRSLATCRLEVVGGNDHVAAIGLATYALQAV